MRVLVACLALGLMLAGCSGGGTDDADHDGTGTTDGSGGNGATTTTAAASPYTLTVSNFPEIALSKGSAFNFQLSITGPAGDSDHIGAHFTNHAVASPTVAQYDSACNHVMGTVPGEYTITCTAPSTAGTYYLRGHLRMGAAPDQVHAWASEKAFTVN